MRGWRWILALILIVGGAAGVYFLTPVEGPARDLTLAGDAERGNYLLRLGGCIACHTDSKNEGPLLAGGAPLETPFGAFVPPNITSDKEAGIGSWTLAEFSNAMSNGQGRSYFDQLYPAFPYDNYTLMRDQDVVDLYAALMASDPVAQKATEHSVSFPFNIRLAMLGWKHLFFHPERFSPEPGRSDTYIRGKYLAESLAHCGACHTPRNMFGARDESQHVEGSSGGSPAGKVPAITKDALLAAGYDRAWIADVLNGNVTPSFDVPGGAMAEVIFEGTVYWTDEDRDAIAAYLLDED